MLNEDPSDRFLLWLVSVYPPPRVSFEGIIVGGGTRLTDPRFFFGDLACGSVNGLIFPFLSAAPSGNFSLESAAARKEKIKTTVDSTAARNKIREFGSSCRLSPRKRESIMVPPFSFKRHVAVEPGFSSSFPTSYPLARA